MSWHVGHQVNNYMTYLFILPRTFIFSMVNCYLINLNLHIQTFIYFQTGGGKCWLLPLLQLSNLNWLHIALRLILLWGRALYIMVIEAIYSELPQQFALFKSNLIPNRTAHFETGPYGAAHIKTVCAQLGQPPWTPSASASGNPVWLDFPVGPWLNPAICPTSENGHFWQWKHVPYNRNLLISVPLITTQREVMESNLGKESHNGSHTSWTLTWL